ncbi:LisH domain-containing protein [Abeliophyllum distichum]|uniref:LisH domain-containing protein n=1 Tax=Abeliophyllum distichum TaxID=126358 RepID=A0ABD1RWN7_9LAMI
MRERRETAVANTSSLSLIALKPRQILLAEQQRKNSTKHNPMAKNRPENKAQLKPEHNSLLFYSLALCLQNHGFSKTLKRFLSEAQIKDDDWEARALNLEDIFSKYLETCNEVHANIDPQKDQERQADGTVGKNGYNNSAASEVNLRKKKKSDKKDIDFAVTGSGKTSEEVQPHDKVTESNAKLKKERTKKTAESLVQVTAVCEIPVDESAKKQKEKKKKKSKLTSQLLDDDEKRLEIMPELTEEKSKDLNDSKDDSATIIESKDKKKKKKLKKDGLLEDGEECSLRNKSEVDADKVVSDILLEEDKVQDKEKMRKKEATVDLSGSDAGVPDRKNPITNKSKKKSVEAVENGANENKMASKKRKRLAHDEDGKQPVDEVAVEESKRRKTDALEEAKGVEQQAIATGANGHVCTENKEENVQVDHADPQGISVKKVYESTNGSLNNNGVEKSSQPKSTRKQCNNSAEPKTVNAFQRVKVDEVKFVDERLQDNSYWAKDGAEIGYGAKAQEILGQVRGRDFRHEKTKKKRGSYRGGQIDLQSHSIKFNYSEEE